MVHFLFIVILFHQLLSVCCLQSSSPRTHLSTKSTTSISFSTADTGTTTEWKNVLLRKSQSPSIVIQKRSEQIVLLDGAEWRSVQRCGAAPAAAAPSLHPNAAPESAAPVGCLSIVTFAVQDSSDNSNERFVALQAPPHDNDDNDNNGSATVLRLPISPPHLQSQSHSATTSSIPRQLCLYAHTIASIPPSLADTVVTSIVPFILNVHCVIPVLDAVGGDERTVSRSGSVVVLGGQRRALAAARALDALGLQVTLVTPSGVPPKEPSWSASIQVLPPAVPVVDAKSSKTAEDVETMSVCDYVGEFDALLDTVGDESNSASTLSLLRERHSCARYVSTVSQAQHIVEQQGLWKSGRAQQHVDQLVAQYSSSWPALVFAPPARFGTTVEAFLTTSAATTAPRLTSMVRGWSLPEYWEAVTWPRDASANIRFGLPSRDEDDDDQYLLRAWLDDDDDDDSVETNPLSERSESNVLQLVGVPGVQHSILDARRDCVLLLSAPFCRSCRALVPRYRRLARRQQEQQQQLASTTTSSRTLWFAQADAVGPSGRALGRKLHVDAVPTFVLFRGGQRFGRPLVITRLPSKRLERALEWLNTGVEWDDDALRELD